MNDILSLNATKLFTLCLMIMIDTVYNLVE